MRSRYAAYAVGDTRYLMDTTHPEGPHHREDREGWAAELAEVCRLTDYEGLEVLGAGEDGDRGWVRFRARLRQGGRERVLAEHSVFLRQDGRWLYHSGED